MSNLKESIMDLEDEIARIEGRLESTGTEDVLSDLEISTLCSTLNSLYEALDSLTNYDCD
jgi:hypothetical protein